MGLRNWVIFSCLSLAVAACGQRTVDEVDAMNLKTGEKKSFASEGDVPPGWAVCPEPGCPTIPPGVPCQNLGEDICEQNPQCRLKTLYCEGTVCPESTPGTPGDPGTPGVPGDPTCSPSEPICHSACVPKLPLECHEITAQDACSTRTDCEWGPSVCPAIACAPGEPCPPCEDSCFEKQAPTCDSLDELSCGQRDDCNWEPQPCPACPINQDGTPIEGCECPAFCVPNQVCPEIGPVPPGFCPEGNIVPQYGPDGCVIGFDCFDVCPTISPPAPGFCADGTVPEPQYDGQGCLVGYTCTGTTGCDGLRSQYQEALKQARACTPGVVGACAVQVSDSLGCGCPTYVDASNTLALELLQSLTQQFGEQGCYENLVCPAMPCFVSNGATCEALPGGPVGECTDNDQ